MAIATLVIVELETLMTTTSMSMIAFLPYFFSLIIVIFAMVMIVYDGGI
jgi:hypothetical protein